MPALYAHKCIHTIILYIYILYTHSILTPVLLDVGRFVLEVGVHIRALGGGTVAYVYILCVCILECIMYVNIACIYISYCV